MNDALEQMLKAYNVSTLYDRKNAMKEIMQEIVLCGLSRAGFFKRAAFYGGTALRIFYGLDRFSEDLDFSLETEDMEFDLSEYFPVLEKEVKSFGLNVGIDLNYFRPFSETEILRILKQKREWMDNDPNILC